MVRTIIFDFDGTIADTLQSSITAINSLANKYGFRKVTKEEVRSEGTQEIIKDRHISLFKLPKLLKDYTTLVQKQITSQHPIDQMPQLLAELNQSGLDLSIITSNSVENVSIFLNKHNLTFFKHIYSDTSVFGKNIVISRFLTKYKLKNEETIYVGDELRDIAAAHKAKIKIISVTWGFNSKEALKSDSPDYLVNKPNQIAEILGGINSL